MGPETLDGADINQVRKGCAGNGIVRGGGTHGQRVRSGGIIQERGLNWRHKVRTYWKT